MLVGKEEKEYILHKSFATKSSEFFKSATSKDWKESKEKRIKLPDVDTAAFEQYAEWLYTSKIPYNFAEDLKAADKQKQRVHSKYKQLMALYVLAYFFLDTAFRNAIVDDVLNTCKQTYYPSQCLMEGLWENTPPRCHMKSILAKFFAKYHPVDELDDVRPPQDSDTTLLEALIRLRDSKGKLAVPSYERRCEYHEHNEEVPKTESCTS